MFPHIVIRPRLMINPIPFKPTIWRVLLIFTPAHSSRFQQINDRLNGGVDTSEAITAHAICVASN